MRSNLKLVVNNPQKQIEERQFFEKNELKVILDLYAKMVSEGSWKDYGLSISSKQVSFSVFRNAAENALYKICKNFNPKNNRPNPTKISPIFFLLFNFEKIKGSPIPIAGKAIVVILNLNPRIETSQPVRVVPIFAPMTTPID